jgi:hypothetical protein
MPGNQYASFHATSLASPHVAGLVALHLGAVLEDGNGNGRLSAEVRTILSSSATDLGTTGRDNQYGFGLVDAPAALAALLGGAPPSGTTAASVSGITYTRTGPAGRHLNIAVRVVDQSQAPIAGAAVSVSVTRDGLSYASGSGATNSSGVATFQIKNAPSGCYSTDVTGISATGVTFDGAEPDNNFCG